MRRELAVKRAQKKYKKKYGEKMKPSYLKGMAESGKLDSKSKDYISMKRSEKKRLRKGKFDYTK